MVAELNSSQGLLLGLFIDDFLEICHAKGKGEEIYK